MKTAVDLYPTGERVKIGHRDGPMLGHVVAAESRYGYAVYLVRYVDSGAEVWHTARQIERV